MNRCVSGVRMDSSFFSSWSINCRAAGSASDAARSWPRIAGSDEIRCVMEAMSRIFKS